MCLLGRDGNRLGLLKLRALQARLTYIMRSGESMMKKNVGQVDKVIRIVVGLLLIALALTGTVGWWGWIGVVLLVTGVLGSCPGYSLLGLSTCPTETSERS
jgi:hypothetical protein